MTTKLFTAKDIETLRKQSVSPSVVPANAMLTPSARDLLRDWEKQTKSGQRGSTKAVTLSKMAAKPAEPTIPDYEFKWTSGGDPVTPEEIVAFFQSPEISIIKERMVEMGRRMWAREYTDGNGGNLTVRVGDNLVLCTPTLICKGFMSVDDICLVDLEGRQLAGTRRRTSEVMTHIGIMKRQPKAKACCHAHPPHATAFAVAKVRPPTCLIPEAEVFLGQIGLAPYQTPGSPANSDTVGEVGVDHQCVLMANHGVITWGKDIEDAYWKMENVDSYCRTVWIAGSLGKNLEPISAPEARKLIELRKSLGMDDYRENWKECELCDNSDFRPGFVAQNTGASCSPCATAPSPDPEPDPVAEALVRAVTDEILKQLKTAKS